MATYRVKPGRYHGAFNQYAPGDTLEMDEAHAAAFLDKLELVEPGAEAATLSASEATAFGAALGLSPEEAGKLGRALDAIERALGEPLELEVTAIERNGDEPSPAAEEAAGNGGESAQEPAAETADEPEAEGGAGSSPAPSEKPKARRGRKR